jgi:hypothetical protein
VDVTSTVVTPPAAADVATDAAPEPDRRAFERWGIVAYLAATAATIVAVLLWLDGAFTYVIDDPAIHLGLADTLVRHGTWGMTAGEFQSASSSPLWTLLVAAGLLVTPSGLEEWLPLALNVAAGVGVVMLLGRNQDVLVPGRGRGHRADVVAVAVLVVVALFLPGLALVGMEHTLHVLLVLAAVIAVERARTDEVRITRRRSTVSVDLRRVMAIGGAGGIARWWLPGVLLAAATLTRFETAFVGAGLALGLLVVDGLGRDAVRRHMRQALGVAAAVGVPVVAFALWNKAMGGGFLPNSVLAKGQGVGNAATATGLSPNDVVLRLRRDPLVVAELALALAYVVLTWGRPARHRVVAVTVVVATLLHVVFADMGWHERYQAYLVALGLYLALRIAADLPADLQRRAAGAIVVVALVLAIPKANFLAKTHFDADNIMRHQYQAGLFLERYYDGEPIATDQLGYISWFHDGPVTDFAGLGDYEALGRRVDDREARAELWQDLAEERGFRVVVTFADVLTANAPDTWVYVGQWCKDRWHGNGFDRCFAFWATDPDEVTPLHDHLVEFEPQLPARVHLELNDWAQWQAADLRTRGQSGMARATSTVL